MRQEHRGEMEIPGLLESPQPPKKLVRRNRRHARPLKVTCLATADIAYVVQSLLFSNRRSHRCPMSYNHLPRRIFAMQKEDIEGWEFAVLNNRAGRGEHWIMAMWNKTPDVVLWEMYDRANSRMEDVIVYLEEQFPGTRVTRHYTGIQPANDFRTCGHNSAFTQLYLQWILSRGGAPTDMHTVPTPPTGWYDFVRELLDVRDAQKRVVGRVNCQTAAHLGLSEHFKNAMDAGRFRLMAMRRELSQYGKKTLR